jgi:hypothetical protein
VTAAATATTLRHDTAEAVRFLQSYTGGDPIQVTAIPPDGKPTTRTFGAGESKHLHQFIEERQGTHNLYFTVNPVREPINKKPRKRDIAEVRWIHVDIDPREGFDRKAERDRIRALLESFSPAPHIVIDSGNGFQAFWHLGVPLPNDGDYKRLEELNRRAADLLGGDNTHNIDRIMRIPGTLNVPTKRKRERGYEPVVAALLRHESGHVDPEEFQQLPDRLFALLRTDAKLRYRWRGNPSGLDDTTRSGFDMSIVAMLKARGFSLEQCEVIHHYFTHGQGEGADVARMYERAAGSSRSSEQYEATTEGMIWNKPIGQGFAPIRLSNFTAKIVTEIIEDDGAVKQQVFEIRAGINGRSACFAIPAKQFPSMNWVVEHLGARAVVEAGYGTKDRLRCAVQTLSDSVAHRHTYKHTGWSRLDGQWVYLHGGGAIGKGGLIEEVDVRPPVPLSAFVLPAPPNREELIRALQADFALLDLAPDHITVPLLAAAYTVVLHPTDFGIHLAGPTGTFKTELAALVQQHFGAEFDARHLPAAWSSTGNALEALTFLAKDAVLVIDDFAPGSNVYAQRKLDGTADRVFRSQGNRSGRARMSADTSLQAPKFPRGMTLSTGEDTPRGQSLRARIVLLTLSPGTVNAEKLSAIQETPQQRALGMAGFLQWLAPRLDDRRAAHSAAVAEHRSRIREAHLRTPDITAQLYVGWSTFVEFCTEAGALDSDEAVKLRARGWDALVKCARHQTEHIAQSEPTRRFINLITAAIGSGAAHLADLEGHAPTEYGRWGWRLVELREYTSLQPQGARIGWVEGETVYLLADAAYAAANRLAGEDQIVLTVSMLKKHLADRGLLKRIDKERRQTRYEPRITVEGARTRVLHLDADTVRPKGDPDSETM